MSTGDELSDLVQRASHGDADAVDVLLQRYVPALNAFVRLKAGPALLARESSSDLAQSVCRDVLENADRYRFRGEAEFRTWLFTTAMRKIADRYEYWQAERRSPRREEGLSDEQMLAGYRALFTPSRHAMAREELERVERAFDALPPQKQEVILLARLVGLSHAEIASKLGKNEGAVRMMLSRALAELSEHL